MPYSLPQTWWLCQSKTTLFVPAAPTKIMSMVWGCAAPPNHTHYLCWCRRHEGWARYSLSLLVPLALVAHLHTQLTLNNVYRRGSASLTRRIIWQTICTKYQCCSFRVFMVVLTSLTRLWSKRVPGDLFCLLCGALCWRLVYVVL